MDVDLRRLRRLVVRPKGILYVALGVAVVWFLVGAGQDPDSGLLPPPRPTAPTSDVPTTTRPDFSEVTLGAVADGEDPPVEFREFGDATIAGAVSGPEGAVPGAIVRIERLVDDEVRRIDVVTDEQGGFVLAGTPGGRFRIRAFQAPFLTMGDPEIFYLADGETRELRFQLTAYTGRNVTSAVAPTAPFIGQDVNLLVRVTDRGVDADGVGREEPIGGVSVEIESSGWQTRAATPFGITGANGTIVFGFRCDRITPVTAVAVVAAGTDLEQRISLDVPPCGPRPTTTTTTTTTTPDDGDSTTTTTDGDGAGDGNGGGADG